jgi:hypothetical protein
MSTVWLMTHVDRVGTAVAFLDEPLFDRAVDGKVTSRVRVRCDGVDHVVELELAGDEWKVTSDPVPESCRGVVDLVTHEYAKVSDTVDPK